MNIIDFIKNGRKRGLSDDFILEEIKRQAPHKKGAFDNALQKGATSSDIIKEVVRQNSEKKEQEQGQQTSEKKEKKNSKIFKSGKKEQSSKSNKEDRLWIRIFIALSFVFITSLSLAFFYRSLFVPKIDLIHPVKIIEEVSIPHVHYPLIKINPEKDDVERFAVSTTEEYLINLKKIMREDSDSEITRVIAEKESKILNLKDFFSAFKINPPEDFFNKVSKEFDLFVYSGAEKNSLGFIAKFSEGDRETVKWMIMRPWESRIEEDFSYFFGYFGEKVPESSDDLLETSYNSEHENDPATIRYREGDDNTGLYYTLTEEDHIIFATSLKAIKELIDRHYQL